MLPYHISSATPDDLPMLDALWDDRSATDTQRFLERGQWMREHQRGEMLVAKINQQVVGFGMITLWAKVAEISDLCVFPAQRNHGIGTGLIQALLTYAHQRRYTQVEIGVLADNHRALALYERLGFVYNRTIHHTTPAGLSEILYLVHSL